mmetsp:Transcript_69837/g.202421  ORF Transcript_69837/g.202421 Transcript_69837/m.202421 type:complete len:256 (+) Transcript_69837:249-1016(+)
MAWRTRRGRGRCAQPLTPAASACWVACRSPTPEGPNACSWPAGRASPCWTPKTAGSPGSSARLTPDCWVGRPARAWPLAATGGSCTSPGARALASSPCQERRLFSPARAPSSWGRSPRVPSATTATAGSSSARGTWTAASSMWPAARGLPSSTSRSCRARPMPHEGPSCPRKFTNLGRARRARLTLVAVSERAKAARVDPARREALHRRRAQCSTDRCSGARRYLANGQPTPCGLLRVPRLGLSPLHFPIAIQPG